MVLLTSLNIKETEPLFLKEEKIMKYLLLTILMFSISGCGVWYAEWKGEILKVERTNRGLAELLEQESSKKIAIESAKAQLESSKLLALAEVERAKGVAEANKIIGNSLKNNEGYLRYLYITNLEKSGDKGSEIIYIPTEAGLPILEAGKR